MALAAQEDDWHIVTRRVEDSTAKPPKPEEKPQDSTISACGEQARTPSEPYVSVMAAIAQVWQVEAHLYESVRPLGPHARPGNCIFYNRKEMEALFGNWMNIQQRERVLPMVYAVFAHELGHVLHRDFEPDRVALGEVKRELEADQFAGYTLSRLNIRAGNVADYYRLTGDDFGGIADSHGSSGQRAEAFMQGWLRGEKGLSEQSVIGVGGLDHP